MRQYKNCKSCSKEFLARDKVQFLCSKECRSNYYYAKKKVKCSNCNIEMLDCYSKNSKTGLVFCRSKECQKVKRKLRYERDKEKEKEMALKKYYEYKEQNTLGFQKHKEYVKNWYLDNRESQLVKKKESWINNREKYLVYKKEYNAEPINKIRKKEWCETNNKRILDYRKDYRSGNGKLIIKMISNRRRVKLKSIIHNFTVKELEQKYLSLNGVCPECKQHKELTFEHIIPVSRVPDGFIYNIDDVTFWCKSCNYSKRDKLYDEWVEYKNAVFAD